MSKMNECILKMNNKSNKRIKRIDKQLVKAGECCNNL